MEDMFSRTEMLIGKAAVEKLAKARVAVFGIGGVGGYAVEALARSGVGAIDLIDGDKVAASNINRQIIATTKTVGENKTEVAKRRAEEINPDCAVTAITAFFSPETAGDFDLSVYDYIIDAIDTVTCKIKLIEEAKKAGAPIISCMGAGNKLDPTAFKVADIYQTKVCPLAKVMRTELKKRGIDGLKVVYSEEPPVKTGSGAATENGKRVKAVPASIAFVPSVAGLIAAGEVIKSIAGCAK